MQVSKNFKSKKAPEDFRKIEWYFEVFSETHEQLEMSGYSISARIIRRGIQVTENNKAVSSKDSRNNIENFEVSRNNTTS